MLNMEELKSEAIWLRTQATDDQIVGILAQRDELLSQVNTMKREKEMIKLESERCQIALGQLKRIAEETVTQRNKWRDAALVYRQQRDHYEEALKCYADEKYWFSSEENPGEYRDWMRFKPSTQPVDENGYDIARVTLETVQKLKDKLPTDS